MYTGASGTGKIDSIIQRRMDEGKEIHTTDKRKNNLIAVKQSAVIS
jgi:hypothetical protein